MTRKILSVSVFMFFALTLFSVPSRVFGDARTETFVRRDVIREVHFSNWPCVGPSLVRFHYQLQLFHDTDTGHDQDQRVEETAALQRAFIDVWPDDPLLSSYKATLNRTFSSVDTSEAGNTTIIGTQGVAFNDDGEPQFIFKVTIHTVTTPDRDLVVSVNDVSCSDIGLS